MIKEINLYLEHRETPTRYLISERDVGKFLKATLKLHHDPGINPYNQEKTSKVIKITSRSLDCKGPYWWSTPDLQESSFNGAKIWEWNKEEKVLWEKEEN